MGTKRYKKLCERDMGEFGMIENRNCKIRNALCKCAQKMKISVFGIFKK